MAYTGQPVPSTTYQQGYFKASDGKSVRVVVPENSDIKAGQLVLLDGFVGFSTKTVKTEAGQTAETVLTIEQAEYETDQINTANAFAKGDKIYWDAATKKLTTAAGEDNRPVGRVTVAKDAKNVIWFILGPQV